MMNPITSVKTCWSILKTLLNNKKIPCIPTDLKKKAELFNSFFAKQSSIIPNSDKPPLTLGKKTEKPISNMTFNCNDIVTMVRSADVENMWQIYLQAT